MEQNHKIKDWRIDIKKAVSKDSASTNQGYSANRDDGRSYGGNFGNFGRGYGERGRGGGPAPWNSGTMGHPFGNDGFGGGWGGGMGGNMGCDMRGEMGNEMGGGMGNGMDGPMGSGMGNMNSGMGGGVSSGMGGGMGCGMGGGMGNQTRNNPWSMPSSGMGGGNGGNMGGMNSSWENQGGRGNGNNFGNDDVWSRGNNVDNDNIGGMMGAGFSTGMGGGAMSNRGMPYNSGMGGPGPMRSHMGGGKKCIRTIKPFHSKFSVACLEIVQESRKRKPNWYTVKVRHDSYNKLLVKIKLGYTFYISRNNWG